MGLLFEGAETANPEAQRLAARRYLGQLPQALIESVAHMPWLPTNDQLQNTDFKAEARSAFESYQQALRPLLNRQTAFRLTESVGKAE